MHSAARHTHDNTFQHQAKCPSSFLGVAPMKKSRRGILAHAFAVVSGLLATISASFIFACGIDASVQAQPERTGTSHQALAAYGSFMTNLQPVAWYKFDETSGLVAYDSNGGNDGVYMPGDSTATDGLPLLGVPGAVNDDSGAAHFGTLGAATPSPALDGGVYRGSFMTATDTSDFSLTKGADTLNRSSSLSGSWGTPPTPDAPGGATWSAISSTGSYYSVASGYPTSLASGGAITQTVGTGTWGQKFPALDRLDTDSQVEVNWDNTGHATTTAGSYQPLILVSRFHDANNFYAARIQETSGAVQLSVLKRVSGVATTLQTVTIASTWDYTVRWRVRFQVDSDRTTSPAVPTLRAKAWKTTDPQPLGWGCASCVAGTDTGTPLTAAGNGIMSSNSGTTNHSIVYFNQYRLQSTGFTVSTWMRPTTESFTNPAHIPLCTGGSVYENYVHYVSKSDTDNAEWLLRHYPESAVDNSCSEDRRWALSAYSYSLKADGGGSAPGQGAGNRFNPSASLVNVWHHVVGVYDPGDSTDLTAGVLICIDGVCYPKTYTDGGTGSGANYADSRYLVSPGNGTAPLRVGASPASGWLQFQGDIDELSIYEYRLTTQNIVDMYSFKK